MPKPKKTGGKKDPVVAASSSSNEAEAKSPINFQKDGNITISIQVRPGAKSNAVTDVSEDAVSIQIAAPPVDGEANTAIVKYFAEILNLKKADASLKGGKSRQKTVTIHSSSGMKTRETILEALRNHFDK